MAALRGTVMGPDAAHVVQECSSKCLQLLEGALPIRDTQPPGGSRSLCPEGCLLD